MRPTRLRVNSFIRKCCIHYKHNPDTVAGINWGSRLSVSSSLNSPPAAAASWVEREEPFRPVSLPAKMTEMLLTVERPERLQCKSTCRGIKDLVGWGGGCGVRTHLSHLEDALRVQTAATDLPRAGDGALVCDRHDEARHRARLLLQGCIHYVPVSHLQSITAEVSLSWVCAALSPFTKGWHQLTLHSVTIQGTFSTSSLRQSYGSSDSSISFPPSSSADIWTLGILTGETLPSVWISLTETSLRRNKTYFVL